MTKTKLCALLAALLVGCAADALAVPETPYDPALLLWYPTLTQMQQAVFDTVYAGVRAGQTEIELPENTAYDDAAAAVNAVLADCPELCMLENYFTLRYYQSHPEIATQVVLTKRSDDTVETVTERARALAAGVSGDWAGALALHDLVCDLTTYGEGANAYNVMGVLSDGVAVCEGYAEAYTLLCRMAGIRCGVVTGVATDAAGVSQSHEWNQVMLAEGGMLVDVTWDDHQDGSLGLTHWYFGLTGEQMSRDHTAEDGASLLPSCTELSLNWHVREGNDLPAGTSEEQMKSRWFAALSALRDGGYAEWRLESAEDFALLEASNEAWTDAFNTERGAEGFYGTYSIFKEDRQRVFRIVK